MIREQARGVVTATPMPDTARAALMEERRLGLTLAERVCFQRRLPITVRVADRRPKGWERIVVRITRASGGKRRVEVFER